MKNNNMLVVFGTRPEAIKLVPLIKALLHSQKFDLKICVTAQHREMLDSVLEEYGIIPDYDLDIMNPGQSLDYLTSSIVREVGKILDELKSSTWRDLEVGGKFTKNDKLSFISDDMLIVGCDIGSETHYARAIDTRGRELSRKVLEFNNDAEGFQKAKDWSVDLAVVHGKKQIVLGLEPTGHYWFCLAAWMVSNGISVVQVNPYAVKQCYCRRFITESYRTCLSVNYRL